MIDKKTFVDFVDALASYNKGLESFEESLNMKFDGNFLTDMQDDMLSALTKSFFTSEELSNPETSVDDVSDILFKFCFWGNFGEDVVFLEDMFSSTASDELKRYTANDLYDLIVSVINKETV